MTKAILIIDMPENCDEHCPLYHRVSGDVYCAKGTKPLPTYGKPDWCPLIPEPERIDPDVYITSSLGYDYKLGYSDGWNACLDALEGEK